MKKIIMVGLLLTVLVSLGGCCWPGHWHGGGHGPGWNQRHDRYEYQDRYRGGYHRYRWGELL